jgi:pimeloyl-ACP methyl ester carboxylesterase
MRAKLESEARRFRMTGATFVLIPGAGGMASYWHRLEPELRRLGNDVIAVDLPGDDESAGFRDYADVVVEAVGDRTANLIVVAQSMGGFTAPLVCERLPVRLLVFLNAMIPAPGETAGAWWEGTGQPAARRDNDLRNGRDPDAEFDMATYFFHDFPPALAAELMDEGRAQAEVVFGESVDHLPDVPMKVLVGADDRLFPADFQRRVAKQRLGIVAEVVPGGHLVALSHPVELAERLNNYRAESIDT